MRETLEFETCLQECPARVFHKSGCYKRVCYKRFTRVSRKNAHKSVPQDCLLQECLARVSTKLFATCVCVCATRVSCEGFPRERLLQECPTRVSRTNFPHERFLQECVLQECPTRASLTKVSHKSVKQCLAVCFGVRVCIRDRQFHTVLFVLVGWWIKITTDYCAQKLAERTRRYQTETLGLKALVRLGFFVKHIFRASLRPSSRRLGTW